MFMTMYLYDEETDKFQEISKVKNDDVAFLVFHDEKKVIVWQGGQSPRMKRYKAGMKVTSLISEMQLYGYRHEVVAEGDESNKVKAFLDGQFGERIMSPEDIAKEIIVDFGVSGMVTTRAGNYLKDEFDQGNDVVLLSAILHSMSPERSRILFQKSFNSLVPGGLVVVHEALISDDGTSPLRAVLFSLNMLVNTGEGQSYSGAEVMGLMEAEGFVEPRVIPLPETAGTSLVVSVKS